MLGEPRLGAHTSNTISICIVTARLTMAAVDGAVWPSTQIWQCSAWPLTP
jgi:hypothetical protein